MRGPAEYLTIQKSLYNLYRHRTAGFTVLHREICESPGTWPGESGERVADPRRELLGCGTDREDSCRARRGLALFSRQVSSPFSVRRCATMTVGR